MIVCAHPDSTWYYRKRIFSGTATWILKRFQDEATTVESAAAATATATATSADNNATTILVSAKNRTTDNTSRNHQSTERSVSVIGFHECSVYYDFFNQ